MYQIIDIKSCHITFVINHEINKNETYLPVFIWF